MLKQIDRQDGNLSSGRNATIDILRLVFAVLIVALHSSPLIEVNEMISYIITHTLSRLSVPYFATIGGYFFFRDKKTGKYRRTISKYFGLYTIWSIVMYLYEFVVWRGTALEFLKKAAEWYFFDGWHHLWYLLAIIYLLVILAFFEKISSKLINAIYVFSFILLAIGIAIDNYGNVFMQIPCFQFLNLYQKNMQVGFPSIVIPFFMMGYALNKPIKNCIIDKSRWLAICSVVGLLLEIGITTVFDLHRNVTLCLFTYPSIYFITIWAINNPHRLLSELAQYCAGVASVMYFAHYIFIIILSSLGMTESLVFIISCVITSAVGILVVKLDNPFLNKAM